VLRFDDPRPKTLKLQAGQENFYRRTDGQRHTIIRPVKDGRIKMTKYLTATWSGPIAFNDSSRYIMITHEKKRINRNKFVHFPQTNFM